MSKLRVGILGGGGILGAHAPGFAAMAEQCEVVAVAEPNGAQHERVRSLVGSQARIVDDYHQVVEADDVDAVDVLLPHHLHAPAAIAAAEAGKPVLVEKVMARNVAECDRMIAAAEEAGVPLVVCHDRRYSDVWEAVKRVVETGALGDVFYWRLDHNQNVTLRPGHWAFGKETLGGGAIMSCLTHQIDALRWYGGEVAAVTCMSAVVPDRMEGESAGVVTARMADGAVANLSINWFTTSHAGSDELWYEMVQACGTRGEVYFLSNRARTRVKLHRKLDQPTDLFDADAALERFVPVRHGTTRGHVRCVEEWVKMLVGEPADVRTFGRDCRGTVEVAEAAYLAEQTGKVIELPLADSGPSTE